jgi:phage N-6-adenine-methyltransferase
MEQNSMKGKDVLFSKKSDDWETPQWLFDELCQEFNFCCDMAASDSNKKCSLYINDLEKVKTIIVKDNEYFFCNPPYSNQRLFLDFSIEHNIPTVFLLPSRTDTKLFHDLIYKNPQMEIRFLKGRLKFSNSENSAPFPSMIVVFKGNYK